MLMQRGQECSDWLAHCQLSQKTVGEQLRGYRRRLREANSVCVSLCAFTPTPTWVSVDGVMVFSSRNTERTHTDTRFLAAPSFIFTYQLVKCITHRQASFCCRNLLNMTKLTSSTVEQTDQHFNSDFFFNQF